MAQGNVLVVEDDDAIRRLLIDCLQEHSCLVDGARDGRDALHRITTKRYAVIVLDVIMPFMSGIDFLDSLQALLTDPSLTTIDRPPAVLVVTAIPCEVIPAGEIQQRFPTIVHDVFRKPIDVTALATKVESLL